MCALLCDVWQVTLDGPSGLQPYSRTACDNLAVFLSDNYLSGVQVGAQVAP